MKARIDKDQQVQDSAETEQSPWQIIYNGYKSNSAVLKEKYSPLLSKEILSKQSKDTYSLANIFKDIAEENVGLARAIDTNQSLKLYHYNDGAIACHHGLSVIEKANCNNDLGLQQLGNEIYKNLNNIQTDMVSVCGGRLELLPNIGNKADLSNISKYGLIDQVRAETKEQIKAIEAAKLAKNDSAYIDLTENAFKQVANDMGEYLAALYSEAEKMLGPPPCDYNVVGLGSMALRQMTPWSDLEFAILTDNENYKQSANFAVREYFRNLTQLVHFKVINLGETIMPISSYGFDFKDFVKTAVNFDLGGKTPLGRMDKPYELIQTVEGMINYLKNEDDKTSHIDKTLLFILQKSCPIYKHGNKDLATEYQSQANEFLSSLDETNGRPYCENRAVQILSKEGIEVDYTKQIPQERQKTPSNLEQFSFNAYESQGKLFDVKQEIYRMPDRFIYNLGMIHGIQEESSWDTIDELCLQGIINLEGASNLKKALSFATNLRLKTYSHYGSQKDTMDFAKTYETQSDLQSQKVAQELVNVFKLTHQDLQEDGALFEYYYTALALRNSLEAFCELDDPDKKEGFFNNNTFYSDDIGTKAQINLRLLRYKNALEWQLKDLEGKENTLGKEHYKVANNLHDIGSTYQDLGDYNKALWYLTKAFDIRKNIFSEDDPYIAHSLDYIGATYKCLGDYKKALEYQEKTLAIKQKLSGGAHTDLGYHFVIGATYQCLGQYKKALEYMEKALGIDQKSLGEDHPDVAGSYDNIGITYQCLGQYKKALEYMEKALGIRQKSLGEDHPDVAKSYNNIGYTYGSLGEHRKALKYQEKALSIFRKSLGENHPDVVRSYDDIGSTYRKLGDPRKALEYAEKALEIQQKSLSEDHPGVACSLDNIGSTYGELGYHHKALEYAEKALEIQQKSLSEDHPDVATSYNNIGSTYGSLGDHKKALWYHEKALAIRQKSLGEDHPGVACSLDNIGSTYGALSDHNKALEYQEKARAIKQKSLGEDHPDVATNYNNIGITYRELGDYNNALEYQEKALAICQKSLGEDHSNVACSLDNIGSTYGSLGDHNKALEYQEKAFSIFRKSLGENHPDTIICKNNISQQYFCSGMYNEALAELAGVLAVYKKMNQPDKIAEYQSQIAHIKRIKNFYEEANKLLEDNSNSVVSVKSYNDTTKVANNLKTALDQFRKCNNFKKSDVIDEKILLTLDLLIKAQTSLYQNSKKKTLEMRRALNEYQKEYDELKKSMDDKQVRLAEIEEYLAEQKQIKDAQSEIESANSTISTIETNSTFTDIPEKSEDGVRVISYNITADFFDNKDTTVDQHHHWKYRAPFVKVLLKKLYPDIMCLQELSAEQALELHQYFNREGGYKSIFLSQTPSEVETGAIACGKEVQEWGNKFLGASLIGTFINKSFEFIETGRFWLNENPDLVPTTKDRGEVDKGFGNMNTYRAVLWAKVKMEGNKSLYIFNSHYPLSGNNETRFKCAELEMNKIQEISEGGAWVSVGDKNIIPTKDDNEQYNPQTVYDELTKHGKNIIQGGANHYGPSTTWIGYTYCSFHHHGAFDPVEFRLTSLTDPLTEEHNKQRYFASDHALIGADFIMGNNP